MFDSTFLTGIRSSMASIPVPLPRFSLTLSIYFKSSKWFDYFCVGGFTFPGGKTLGVSKPKRQDTLESTWKTITDGRSMPLTRHVKKQPEASSHTTLNHRNIIMSSSNKKKQHNNNSSLVRQPSTGKLRKEPSQGQEELNQRVEAFINKFNQDMRIQRQESLNRYMEIINRGAHLT